MSRIQRCVKEFGYGNAWLLGHAVVGAAVAEYANVHCSVKVEVNRPSRERPMSAALAGNRFIGGFLVGLVLGATAPVAYPMAMYLYWNNK